VALADAGRASSRSTLPVIEITGDAAPASPAETAAATPNAAIRWNSTIFKMSSFS
jgi:hypothetical protein